MFDYSVTQLQTFRMKSVMDYSVSKLRQILSIKEQIEILEDQLATVGNGTGVERSEIPAARVKRPMSAAARRKIAAAQRARWAKQKGALPTESKPKRRKMSAEGRARIAAAARARWA